MEKLKSEDPKKLENSSWLKRQESNANKIESKTLNKLIIEYYAYLEEILADTEDRIRYTGRVK